jgi:hypothetical protein
MPRFVVHVGPHKTGTTYLQTCFSMLQSVLQGKGVFYPVGWQGGRGPGHADLVRRLSQGPDRELEQEFGSLSSSNYEIVLISAEDLSTLDQAAIRHLKDLVGNSPADILFYIRRPADLLFSAWQESIKHGNVNTLSIYVAQHFLDPFSSKIVNPALILDSYAEVFGLDNVKIICYNVLEKHSIDLFEHFASMFLGLKEVVAPEIQRANPSMTPIDAEIWRIINAITRHRGGMRRGLLPREFAWGKRTLNFSSLAESMQQTVGLLKIDDASPVLRIISDRLMLKYGQSIVEPRIPRWLFPRKVSSLSFIRQEYLLLQGVLDELARIYDAFAAFQEKST